MEAQKHLSIEEKIGEARSLYQAWSDRLWSDARVRDLLERMEERVQASMRTMWALRIVQACKWCEEQEGGSCCGAGIENRYDPIQLLINLLLDVSLPDTQKFPDSCYFLDTDGCCLQARHVLCVNYLCKRLEERLSPEELGTLQRTVGEELETGFALHEALRREVGRLAGDE